jgi:hypothetical protein
VEYKGTMVIMINMTGHAYYILLTGCEPDMCHTHESSVPHVVTFVWPCIHVQNRLCYKRSNYKMSNCQITKC